jgi:nitrous oxidase accessory protein
MFSHSDTYITNVFKKNGAGVAVMYTKNVKMFNNYFEENWGDSAYGLLLKDIQIVTYLIIDLFETLQEFTWKVLQESKVEKNIFESNGWGMKIQASCMENEIVNNNFLKNTFDISTNGSLVLNTFNY